MNKERSYWNQILDFFGFKDVISEKDRERSEKKNSNNSKIVSINKKSKNGAVNKDLKLIIYNPDSYNEVKAISDDLKNKMPVILNLENVEKDQARRFIDFISGAVYGINGNVQKIGSGVFLFTPQNVEVDGEVLNQALQNDVFSQ